MVQPLGYNDGILLVSLLYSCVDLASEWDSFERCSKPVHHWLLVSYCCVIGFRAVHLLGSQAASGRAADAAAGDAAGGGSGDFLLDMRHKTALPRALATFTWVVALPFFMLWTYIGTMWLWDVLGKSPTCMPTTTHLWFAGFWLVLCYVWVIIHGALGVVAWVLERRVQRAEGDLRAIEDADVRSRWGEVSQLTGYQALEGGAQTGGLCPTAILALPCEVELGSDRECPICITQLEPGDSVRRLPDCDHVFHRSCIDLWLLRRADCPLCKREVHAGGAESV